MFFQVLIEFVIIVVFGALIYLVISRFIGWVLGEEKSSPEPKPAENGIDTISSLKAKIRELEAKKVELKELTHEVKIASELKEVESKIEEAKKGLAALECQQA